MTKFLMLLVANTLFLQWVAGDDNFTCTPHTYFPHPSDCSMYYHCDDQNIQQLFFCPYSTYYNPQTNACDLPNTGGCPVPENEGEDEEEEAKIYPSSPAVVQEDGDDKREDEVAVPNFGGNKEQTSKELWRPVVVESEDEEPSEITSGSNKFFYAVRNFEKALEEGGTTNEENKETTTALSENVRRQRSENETTSPDVSTEAIQSVKETEVTSGVETTSTSGPEEKVPESKCNADSFSVKSLPTFPIVGVLLGKKDEEGKPIEIETKEEANGDGEVKTGNEEKKPDESTPNAEASISNDENSTLGVLTNFTFGRDGFLKDQQEFLDVGKVTTEVEHQNATAEEEPVFKIPDFTFVSPVAPKIPLDSEVENQNVTHEEEPLFKIPDFTFVDPVVPMVPFGPADNGPSNIFEKSLNVMNPSEKAETFEGNEKAEEIEEAKSTLIFESHTEAIQDEKSQPDDYTKVIMEGLRVK